jgi:hypothetical protein
LNDREASGIPRQPAILRKLETATIPRIISSGVRAAE